MTKELYILFITKKKYIYKSSFHTSRPISPVRYSWDSQSSEQIIIPEIQLNDEGRAVDNDARRSVGLSDMPDEIATKEGGRGEAR